MVAVERAHQGLAGQVAGERGRHLYRVGHPGELTDLGHDALARLEVNRQHGHRRSVNPLLHGSSSRRPRPLAHGGPGGTPHRVVTPCLRRPRGARILETMYRAARPGGLGEQVGTLAGAGGGSWPPRAGPAVITSAALL